MGIFLGRVSKESEKSDVKLYIQESVKIKIIKCEQLEFRADPYKAFKISVNSDDHDTVLNLEIWPRGTTKVKYHAPKFNPNLAQ